MTDIFPNQEECIMQRIEYESGNFLGAGESATFNILKYLTNLKHQSLKEFPKNGIYKQVPLEWLIHEHDYNLLSDAHKKGSVDIVLVVNQTKIAIRVQGKGHGQGLKGIGKAKHDTVQANLLKKYCGLVDIHLRECPNIFKERVTQIAIEEVKGSFKTANVLIPVI